jgi:hypothetical protein
MKYFRYINVQNLLPKNSLSSPLQYEPFKGQNEREKVGGGAVVVRGTTIVGGGVGNNIFSLKVPRHCPLVLLIGARLEFRINSIFFYF